MRSSQEKSRLLRGHRKGSEPESPRRRPPRARRWLSTTLPARLGGGGCCRHHQGRRQGRGRRRRRFQRCRNARGSSTRRSRTYGRLDILVNNSGVYQFATIEEVTRDLVPQAVQHQRAGPPADHPGGGEAPEGKGPASSTSVLWSAGSHLRAASVYTGTKGAVNAITWRALPRAAGAKKIRVNALNPGMVETEGKNAAARVSSAPTWKRAKVVSQTPLGRLGQPGYIASIAVFLASDDFGWMTGELLNASGGL